MKITNLETFHVKPRWMFLKISTDEGIVGWGEPVLEGRARTVEMAINELRPVLIGANPMRIEHLWQTMYCTTFYRGGPILTSCISGIEQALWDIKGKKLGVPVYELLGGACRDKLRVYRWIGGDRPSDIKANVLEAKAQGYSAIKMNATEEMHYIDSFKKIDAVCERVAIIRDTLGMDMDIAVDFHGRVHKTMARVLAKELDQFHLMFIEEPVLSQNNEAMRDIRQATCTPIATGERMFSRWEFKNLLEAGYVDIIQPDLSHAGGISECKKIAAMAEAYDVAVAPHCPLGPIAFGACVQLDSCTPNAFIQEQSLGIHYNKGGDLLDYLADASIYEYHEGFMGLLKGPGLGVTMNEEYIKEKAKDCPTWKNPIWRNFDGTVAEW